MEEETTAEVSTSAREGEESERGRHRRQRQRVRVGVGSALVSATEVTNMSTLARLHRYLHPTFTATTSPSNADFPLTSPHPHPYCTDQLHNPFPGVNGSHRWQFPDSGDGNAYPAHGG
jgi:hypothetical protein